MTSQARQPRLVVVVANDIRGDSRVQKTAIAAARDGWDVTVVGSTNGQVLEETTMGPLKVIRVPAAKPKSQSRLSRTADRLAQTGKEADNRSRSRGVGHVGDLGMRFARRVVGKLRHEVRQLRARRTLSVAPTGDWRRDWPPLAQLDKAFGPVIDDLKPDLIHANDIATIVIAAHSVERLRARGLNCSWIYDAHEYIRGVQWPTRHQASAFTGAEREFISAADAVVTVSTQLAEMLRTDYQLATSPVVVGNSPVREIIAPTSAKTLSVRALCNLDDDVPLMVYAGWLGKERGLDTVVAAMPKLPGYHLAMVVGRSNPLLKQLLLQAETLGVRDRIHLLPYVPQHEVAAYLQSADLGLIPFLKVPNCEISLPTKISEYLHARLPLVTSDVKVVRAFVEEHGIGEVFTATDVDGFVVAAEKAYEQRAMLSARISEAILDDLSWEHQSKSLLRLYRSLSTRVPAAPADVPWDVQEDPPPMDPLLVGDWREIGDTRVRLGLGPANYAGQGAAFARAICREMSDVSAEVVMVRQPESFGFPANVYIDAHRLTDFGVQSQQIHRVVGRYTHVLVDAFMPVFGHLNGTTIEGDLAMLGRAGVQVAILAHGSEIRDPRRHLKNHEFSLFRDAPAGVAAQLSKRTQRNQKIADSCGLPLFVTTPDLLDDLPTATWTPLVIDVDAWACDRPVMERKRPIVMHAPSKRWTKGTDRILPALTRLHKQGAIDLRLAEGIPWEQMKELVKESDIVLDQFTTGAYGTLGCEAMAAGKPVVAYISERVATAVGPDLPVVPATPLNLSSVLESMLDDRAGTARVGAASARFVREFHDGRRTAAVLAKFLR
ncbi:glycosyltransferase family 4 protein [Catellatospora paridis]|uniref:glycosyltransferase family 4 protein n=1 Tax=Catellatospora paridis TaxID=1617086 RepID=UPI0012D3DF32|nr:glycosyltransferase [Catellatospora paridis]